MITVFRNPVTSLLTFHFWNIVYMLNARSEWLLL